MTGPCAKIFVQLLLICIVIADWVEVSVVKPHIKSTVPSVIRKSSSQTFYGRNQSKLGSEEVENYSRNRGNPFGQGSFGGNSSQEYDVGFNAKTRLDEHEDQRLSDELQTLSVITAPDHVPEMLERVHRKLLVDNPTTPSSKVEFLRRLRNQILHKMKRSMENVWGAESRQARTSKMGYPSLESALMSISFLIFAVFLIKLIEQLIHSLSGGNYGNGSAALMQVVPSTASIIGRKRRDVEKTLATARIITLMDDFPVGGT